MEDFWIDLKKRGYFAGVVVISGLLLLVGQPWALGTFGMGIAMLTISGGWTAVRRRRGRRSE
jgi:protein-S-isoprenylcysteine O-methyltransferase Ste14